MTDKNLIKLMKQVRVELHKRMGRKMCPELYKGCIDCDTRMLIGFINEWIGILTPFKKYKKIKLYAKKRKTKRK